MATQKKAPARKAPAKKAPAAKKAAAGAKKKAPASAKKKAPAGAKKKAPASKAADLTLKDRAQKGVNVYLGLWGVGYDLVQENLEYARKDNKLNMTELEKRGEKLRKQLRKNMGKFEAREFDQMFDGAQEQFDKLQKKLDELAKDIKVRRKPKSKAGTA
jgi:hypothetical protein